MSEETKPEEPLLKQYLKEAVEWGREVLDRLEGDADVARCYFPAWNPRYVSYARAHNRTPEEQKAAEPGNAGFLAWMSQQLAEYREEHGLEEWSPINNDDLDTWLWMSAESERVLTMSDEEILADCHARGEDPAEIAQSVKAALMAGVERHFGPREASHEQP